MALSTGASAQFTAAPGSPFPVGVGQLSVAVGDFNGDGKADLAVADQGSSNVFVLLGNGAGGFAAAKGSPFNTEGDNPWSVAVGDFNGDGKPDLAIANTEFGLAVHGTVAVLLNDGAGGFTAAQGSPFPAGASPICVAVGGINQNGEARFLATANDDDATVTVLLNNGMGFFTAAPGSPFVVGLFPWSVTVGDFNGDGQSDLAVTNRGDNTVTVLLSNGLGGFTVAPGSPFPVGLYPYSVAVGDFNGDGKADLAVTNAGDNTVTVLLGNGAGGFTAALGSPFPVGSSPTSVVVADFNGDGRPDLAIANQGSSDVTVLLGNGTGGFTEALGSPFPVGSVPLSMAVGDFNGDGKPDLAVANSVSENVTVLLNTFPRLSAPVTVSAATGTAPVAPGSIVSIYGGGLGNTGTSATMLPLPTNLGGTSVTITDCGGVQAALPLFYAGPTQINAEIPQTANTGAASLNITTPSGIQFGSVTLAAIAPGLFSANETGQGVASAQFVTNEANGTQTIVDVFQCSGGAGTCVGIPLDVSEGNAALVLYGTGIRNRASLSDVTVTVGGQTLPASYAGAAPNYAGEDQVNVLLPPSLAGGGTVGVSVSVAGSASNSVTVTIE